MSYLRRFYFDTITHSGVSLKFLVELVEADRVVIGTDIPSDMADLSFETYFSTAHLAEQAVQAISNGNASQIFGLDTGLLVTTLFGSPRI